MGYGFVGMSYRLYNRIPFVLQSDDKGIVAFDTSICTDNSGDFIIMKSCNQVLRELFGECDYTHISTHRIPSSEEERIVRNTKYKFVCGTNILTSHVEQWWNWRLPDGFKKKLNYRNVILLGAGWGVYQDECSDYSKMVYRSLLHPNIIHSVRDHYTEEKLKQAGIRNVINTGCPTMWQLTPEFCRDIPLKKAKNVITTVTDYRKNAEQDNQMLKILGRNYEKVYLWLQGVSDEKYLGLLKTPDNLEIIPAGLDEYEARLNKGEVDYVGTRLHAGIFALNHHIRSIVIAVDNRAIEIAKDTNLPVVLRENIGSELEQRIFDQSPTDIRMKLENIRMFKEQFYK